MNTVIRHIPKSKGVKLLIAVGETYIKKPRLTRSSINFAFLLYDNTFNKHYEKSSNEITYIVYQTVQNQIRENTSSCLINIIIGSAILSPLYVLIPYYSVFIIILYTLATLSFHTYKLRDMRFVLDIYSAFKFIDNILPDEDIHN